VRARGTRAKHARRLPFAVVVTTLVLGGLALLLALNTAAAANELRRHSFAARDQVIAARVEQLRNEIAASAAPGNLATAAAAFGMVPAGNPAFIVDVDGHLIVRGRPLPVPEPVNPLPSHSTSKKKKADKAKRSHGAAKTTNAAATTTSTTASTSTTTTAAHDTTTPPPSTSAAPSPSATPTPTVTLPGGPR
jgi:hypothetical protein